MLSIKVRSALLKMGLSSPTEPQNRAYTFNPQGRERSSDSANRQRENRGSIATSFLNVFASTGEKRNIHTLYYAA